MLEGKKERTLCMHVRYDDSVEESREEGLGIIYNKNAMSYRNRTLLLTKVKGLL